MRAWPVSLWLFALTVGGGRAAAEDATTAPPGMIRVPGGKFFYGRQWSDKHPEIAEGEEISIAGFWIDRTEVTAADYLACVKAKACPPIKSKGRDCNANQGAARAQHPMNCVSAIAADAYCRSQGKRLPLQSEWEHAARGNDKRIFPWGNAPPKDQLCWNPEGKAGKTTCPVGSYPQGASPYGALDMAGNVAEWTGTQGDRSSERVFKGGSYAFDQMEVADDRLSLRSDEEESHEAKLELPTIGFRCARDENAAAATPKGPTATEGVAVQTPASPPRGSPERKELLDAVRVRLGVGSEFVVDRLVVAGDWAYFEGREHRPGGGPAAALLRRAEGGGKWEVVDAAGGTTPVRDVTEFRARIMRSAPERHLPDGLLPR